VRFEQGDIGVHIAKHSPWIPKENSKYSYAWIKGAAGAASLQQVGKFVKGVKQAMKKAGVERIIALGGKGILDAPGGGLLIDQEDYPQEFIPVGREHQKAWEYLTESNLDWTFICSPDIINADPTGDFITSTNVPPVPDNSRINAGDLALFMLQEQEKNQYLKQRVGITEI